jgi:putative Holliday junction resolvase
VARIIALDVGSKRIGFAVSDELGVIATPRGLVPRQSYNKDAAAIGELVEQEQAERVLVGLPTGLSGRPTEQTRRSERFAEMLASRLSVPVELWDERLTTVMARRIRPSATRNPAREAESVDAVAAALILQSYLDRRSPLSPSDSSSD